MATIRIFNDIFDDKSRDFIYDTSKPLLEQIEEHLDKDYYKSTMVECYDPDTKKTFYAPMEDEDEKEGIILYANGESVTETYIPSENDIVHVVFVPLSGMSNAGWGALIGLGAGIALGLMTGGAGFTALFPALTWTAGNVAFATIAGGALGALIGWTIGDKIDQMQKAGGSINDKKTGEQLPDVRGCSNQSLLGNNFPFVIGKHLVTPFIIGDPYTEYSGERGEDAYIRELLCVGYGPLKLTDFKLGDFMLAYNRSHNNITKDTMIAGLLKGYSTGGVADNGDIVDYWSKNDVELEIIQQPDGAEIISIDPYFQDRTKIDLSQRPLVSAETMNAAGWNVPAGETCTVYSQGYSNQDESVTVLMTPINPDGTVLTPSELDEYADDCLSAGSYVNTATITGNVTYNPAPYQDPYVINSLSLAINFAINEAIELQAQFNNNWTTVLTLPAGGVNASLSGTPRWAGTNCRLKIGDWTSAHFNISDGTKNIELPESVEIEAHPYNLLATFTGSDSAQQSEDYAQALHENQEDYYFNRDCIGYGSIYTEVTKESVSDANIFFLSDKDLDERTQVVYKGSSFPNQFRTNTVILSDACPRQFTINLDFPSGLYSTYTQTVNDETETKYAKIPLWMCIQWRIYDSTKKSSDPKGTDYDDWNTVDFGPLVNKTFSTSEQNNDKAKHKGNNFDNLSLDDLYQGFRGKTLQNFEYYSGDDGVSEFRVSATVTLTKEQCKQIMADTNPARIIEIRVLRVSPNYLNQTSNNSDTVGPYSYSDHVKVLTTVVKTFDMEALRNDDELKPVRVLSEKDLKKLCLVAIKAKADKAGYLQNNMESITCTAESFSPIWDSESKKILPEGITKVRKYYGYFEGNTDIRTNRTNTAYERELTGPDARQQYEDARHDGFNWYMEKAGSNFPSLIKNIVYDDPILHNDTLCWYLPDRAKKFNNNLASSGALLALFGEQEGPEGIGLEDLNVVALSEWAEKSAAVNDGTTAPMAMDYNGHHYNEGDLIPVRYEANAYIYQGVKIEDLLQKLAFCGRAAWVIDEAGQVKFIMDAPVDYTKGAINAQNCISSSNSFNYEEPPAGLFITFHDENDGYENNSFYVWTDGNSASRYHGSVEQMSMDYITNNVQVTSLARYTLASRVQNKEILTRKIGPGGIIYSLGDVVLVQSDELLIGDVSGRIQEVIENNGTIYGFVMDSDYEYTAELGSSGNSVQGVTIIQPSYMGKSNAVTLPLSAPRSQSVPLDYEQVYPTGNENPQQEGWYVKNGDEYVLTTDTTVVSGHVYYKAIMVNYTLRKGITNIVLFGKVIGDQYGIPRDTSGDYSAKTDIKYNFKTGDIAMMGLIEKISAPYRISKIKPEAGGKFTETLIPYDESFYNYGKALPTFQSYITPPSTMSYSVPLSETPTTLKEQNDSLQGIYTLISGGAEPVPPAAPTNLSAIAGQDGIEITWQDGGSARQDVANCYYIEVLRGSLSTLTYKVEDKKFTYLFNRSSGNEGYPTAAQLANWSIRIKTESVFGLQSSWVSASLTTTGYLTWQPPAPTNVTAVAYRDYIQLSWSCDTSNVYGANLFTIKRNGVVIESGVGEYNYRYYFNRNNNEYPEKSDFDTAAWTFTIMVSNQSGLSATSSSATYDKTNYKTWHFGTPVLTVTPLMDYIEVKWSVSGDYYGNVYFDVSVNNSSVAQNTSAKSYFYYFDRFTDHYPEIDDIEDDWTFSVTAHSEAYTQTQSTYTLDDSLYKTWIIATPVITPKAYEERIEIPLIADKNSYGNKLFDIYVDNTVVASNISAENYTYVIQPMLTAAVQALSIKVREKSEAGYTDSAVVHPDVSEYKGYTPVTPTLYITSSSRSITLRWNEQTELYGNQGVLIQVAKAYKIVNDEYTPIVDPAELVWYAPALGLNPYESLDNYKQGNAGEKLNVATGSVVSFSVPLYGQPNGSINTLYAYRIKAKTTIDESAWTSITYIEGKATSAADVVKAWELNNQGQKVRLDGALGVQQIFVEELAALSANLGYITDGAMQGDQYNYWAVNDTVLPDQTLMRRGSFRVGGEHQYIQVTPEVINGVATGNYDIDFVINDFMVSATGDVSINGNTFTVYDDDNNVIFQTSSTDGNKMLVEEGVYYSDHVQYLFGCVDDTKIMFFFLEENPDDIYYCLYDRIEDPENSSQYLNRYRVYKNDILLDTFTEAMLTDTTQTAFPIIQGSPEKVVLRGDEQTNAMLILFDIETETIEYQIVYNHELLPLCQKDNIVVGINYTGYIVIYDLENETYITTGVQLSDSYIGFNIIGSYFYLIKSPVYDNGFSADYSLIVKISFNGDAWLGRLRFNAFAVNIDKGCFSISTNINEDIIVHGTFFLKEDVQKSKFVSGCVKLIQSEINWVSYSSQTTPPFTTMHVYPTNEFNMAMWDILAEYVETGVFPGDVTPAYFDFAFPGSQNPKFKIPWNIDNAAGVIGNSYHPVKGNYAVEKGLVEDTPVPYTEYNYIINGKLEFYPRVETCNEYSQAIYVYSSTSKSVCNDSISYIYNPRIKTDTQGDMIYELFKYHIAPHDTITGRRTYASGIGFTQILYDQNSNCYKYVLDSGAMLEFDENGRLIVETSQGPMGPKGDEGAKGDPGTTPQITAVAGAHINEVGTPTVTQSGTAEAPVFTFDYLKGQTGAGSETAERLETARDLKVDLTSSNAQSFDGSANATSIGVAGTLPVANGGTGRTTAPNIRVNLASTSSVSELPATGDVSPGVTGTLPVANGGTGQTTAGEAATTLLTGLPDWTAIPTDTTKLVRRDIDGSASFGQVQFGTVCDYLKGKWTYRTEGSTTKLKININSTSAWMLCFVVTLYQGYRATKIMVSGYHYSSGSNIWYEPEAVILGDSNAAETISVYFGYDSATNLWVGFDGGNYTGLVISDVVNGYKAISNYYNLFTISNVSSFGGTTQKTVTARAYSSYLYGLVGRAVKDYVTLDLSSLDESKWYPVTFDLSVYGFTEMECYVSLNSGTKPSWSTHNNGFSCHLHLLTMGMGWGTTAGQTIALDRNYSFSNIVPVGWTQMTNSSTGVLWLRGGGKYYAWNNRGSAFTIRTSDYTISSQTVSPTTTYQWSFTYATMSASIDGSANSVDGYHADNTSTNNLIRVTRGSDPGASKVGYYAGMTSVNAGDGATKWWHILSMDWSGSTDNPTTWTSQLLLPTEQGGTPKYRRNNTGGTAIGSSTWHSFITDENIASQSVSTATTANKIRTSNSNPANGDIWIQ